MHFKLKKKKTRLFSTTANWLTDGEHVSTGDTVTLPMTPISQLHLDRIEFTYWLSNPSPNLLENER